MAEEYEGERMGGAARTGLSRVRRFWQVHPGAPNVLSTAGSFSPPVGSHLRTDSSGGYYIDFAIKADEPRWPPQWLAPGGDQLHVATAQWGLGCLERRLVEGDDAWLAAATGAADHLLAAQQDDGGWPHGTRLAHTYWLDPPWLSAMAQGEGASLLVRVHRLTGDARYAEAARAALGPMQIPSRDGGVRGTLDGGFVPEEYPTDPPSHVLNGALFALWGCRDVAVALDDESASALYEEGIETLASNLHRYDTGYWSLYDLFPHPVRNVASSAYHLLHINQLRAQQLVDARPQFADAIERFDRYRSSPVNRTRAFAGKASFRLAVPRNRRLARRLPWAHRPRTTEVLVLCYHSVSDQWPSRLAVRTGDLQRQLAGLAERGYVGATFSDAVGAPTGRRIVAVTFDDGYSSLVREALPILSDLGFPATVFMPTGFVGAEQAMSWPGIEQWLGTPHESELEPLDWNQIELLAAAGWEIGSHGVNHPRLTALPDDALEAELLDSRLELERRLGTPCRSIAYPYGAYDERVIAATRRAGYRAAATLPARFEGSRRLAWPRVGVYRADGALMFRAKVSPTVRRLRGTTAWEALGRARGLVRRPSRVESGEAA